MKTLIISAGLVLLLAATARAQQPAPAKPAPPTELGCQVLTGRVTDPFAYPLTGATIMLRSPDKKLGTEAFSTNSEGHYIITLKQPIPRNSTMEVKAVGYAALEVPLANCQPLDLTLTPLAGTTYKLKSRARKARNNGSSR